MYIIYIAASNLEQLVIVTKEFSCLIVKVNKKIGTCTFYNTMHLDNDAFIDVLSSFIY